jgi:hypothetical protein
MDLATLSAIGRKHPQPESRDLRVQIIDHTESLKLYGFLESLEEIAD